MTDNMTNAAEQDRNPPPSPTITAIIPRLSNPPPLSTCPTTIVTAYYRIESKFNQDTYVEWMGRFFANLHACTVVFTDVPEALAPFKEDRVTVVHLPNLTPFLDELHTSDVSFWEAQLARDKERSIHRSYRLYWVWLSKVFFVNHAVEWNPFGSDFFAWLDIGIIRYPQPPYDLTQFVPPPSFDKNAALYGQVRPFMAEDLVLSIDGRSHRDFEGQVHLAGGLFLLHRSHAEPWKNAFIAMWRQYALDDGYFAGKDQDILAGLCVQRPHICQLVSEGRSDDEWYTVLHYMQGGQFTPFHLEPTHPPCYAELMDNLPYDNANTMRTHHWDAGHPEKWNENERWTPFDARISRISYVGANTHGEDGVKLAKLFPEAELHMYEPIPAYFRELEAHWAPLHPHHHLHNYGLGESTRTVRLSAHQLQGQSTFAMQESTTVDVSDDVIIRIQDAAAEFEKHGLPDLLHVNCEGCEWELLRHLRIPYPTIVQVSLHYLPTNMEPEAVAWSYCRLRHALSATHDLRFGHPFGWQRWVQRPSI
jgi:FkbM family methyltransferase